MFAICFSKTDNDAHKVEAIRVFPSDKEVSEYLQAAGAVQPNGWGSWSLPTGAFANVLQIFKPGFSHLDFDFAYEHSDAGKRNREALNAWGAGGCKGEYVREEIPVPGFVHSDDQDVDGGAVWLIQTWHGCTGREESGKTYGGSAQTVVGPFADLEEAEKYLASLKWEKRHDWKNPQLYKWERRYYSDYDDIEAILMRDDW